MHSIVFILIGDVWTKVAAKEKWNSCLQSKFLAAMCSSEPEVIKSCISNDKKQRIKNLFWQPTQITNKGLESSGRKW